MTFEEAVRCLGGEMHPSPGEAQNGWTTQSLTIYHAERQQATDQAILNPKRPRPDRTTNKLRWP